ncbi:MULTISPECIES: polyprenyl synthetase family protein [Amniculibacterium]|uniref:polyprenyl synthetase family protein n=1 Tax=Amniculibacterium TaxID=2715289 RepID=UPI000F5AC776|nr:MULTISPECIES: polyprenyl synthetase family protein [Amniculibacterium]
MEFLDQYHKMVSQAIEKYTFRDKPAELYEPMNYIIRNGGKRLRPVMVLLATDLFGGDLQKAMKPALAIEYFHNFTLIHDDIMDEAPMRRNTPTIHTVYGVNTGILSGDGLLLKAYTYFEDLDPELYKACLRVFTHTGLLLCEGQQYDINFETKKDVSYDDYIRMITYKTGVLSASSFQIGAMIAGASTADAKAIFNYGKHLGIAFQMMDDYLDVYGDNAQIGKKHAGDIFENKKTILYLLAKENASPDELKELEFWYSKKTDNLDKIYCVEKIFRRTKADVRVQQLIQKHNDIAQNYLKKININEEKKKPFIELANFLLKREF